MKSIEEVLTGVKTVGIGGHVRPDGDSVGSCMGLYLYLKRWHPELQPDIYLEEPAPVFSHIDAMDEIRTEPGPEKVYDLFITCDVSARDRLGVCGDHFDHAKKTVCIDHHVSNPGFADVNHICADVSSASEVLYTLLDPEKVERPVAVALYTGIIHDTGVFQYSSTSPRTMQIAAELMKTGFDFNRIIDESFYQKTYIQNQVMGRVLTESILLCDGAVIVGCMRLKDMDFYGVTPKDLDGIVSQLRLTKGVRVAIFLYELEPQVFKVSLRSNGSDDVSRVAVAFGGGGHTKAAGLTMQGSMYDVVNNITAEIERQSMDTPLEGE
jgi:phosphoesterase RecJ-like protein